MSRQPKVSFIIPCYNDGDYIRKASSSIEGAASFPHEMIVVDDGSTDTATLEILAGLERTGIKVLKKKNGGPASARNMGIASAAGKYILPLDADNRIRRDFVDQAIAILDSRPEIGIVHSDFQYEGLLDHLCRIDDFETRKMLYTNYIDTCALYRKKVWEDCGGYDEDPSVKGLEDWELWLNADSRGWQFLHLNIVGFDYTAREGSQLSETKKPENWGRARTYIATKYSQTLKEYYDDYHRWDYHSRQLRRRPIQTMFRLLAGALWPRLHDRIYKLEKIDRRDT